MKKVWLLLGCLSLSSPVLADEVPDETAVPAEPVPETEAPAAEAPAETPAAEAAEEAPAEAVAAEPAAEEPAAEAAPAAERTPLNFYVGVDAAKLYLSLSNDNTKAQFGGTDFNSKFYFARAGIRIFDVIGIEAHYGVADDKGDDADTVKVDHYWGVYAVPTGTFLDTLEISVPVGFSSLTLSNRAAKKDFNKVSFGMNIELPLRALGESLPDLRIGGGGMVYQAENDARIFGYHVGVRYDFKI